MTWVYTKERILNQYKTIYKAQGIDGLTVNNYQGRQNRLSDDEIEALKNELRKVIIAKP